MLPRPLAGAALALALASPTLAQTTTGGETSGATNRVQEATGTIESVDSATGSIRLDTGEQFRAGEGVSLDGLKEGQEVTVMYEETDGRMEAAMVAPSTGEPEASDDSGSSGATGQTGQSDGSSEGSGTSTSQ